MTGDAFERGAQTARKEWMCTGGLNDFVHGVQTYALLVELYQCVTETERRHGYADTVKRLLQVLERAPADISPGLKRWRAATLQLLEGRPPSPERDAIDAEWEAAEAQLLCTIAHDCGESE